MDVAVALSLRLGKCVSLLKEKDGKVVAVYDLGGGTFDAAILRKTADGFEIVGRPEGIERMGGIDFDAAVFAHVDRALDQEVHVGALLAGPAGHFPFRK